MPSLLKISLLGGFQITHDDAPVIVNSTRLQALVTYLATHRAAPLPRRQLAFALWPESSEAQAHTNLRRELHHLRRVMPMCDQWLEVNGATLAWRADAPVWLDVAEFEQALTQAATLGDANQRAEKCRLLHAASEQYGGPLLPNCYDEWILPRREELAQRYLHALGELAALQEDARDYQAAIRTVERLLRHDPLLETSHRRLMRLHALNQDRARALRVYHDCCALLEQELGVEPAAETQRFYQRLLAVEATPAPPPRKQQLLAANTPLVGRQAAWQRLLGAYHVAHGGHARVALIVGEAGIGKSRLAEELLSWAAPQGILTAKSRAYMAQGSLAYAPIVDILRTHTMQQHWAKLDDVWLDELVWLLPELQSDRGKLDALPAAPGHWQRRRLLEALTHALLAGNEPRVLVIDDLQWCDQETLLLLQFLLTTAPRAPLLVVGTVRPEEIDADHPLTPLRRNLQQEEQVLEIELGPLSAAETTELALQVAEDRLVTAAHLYAQTEGNPLFIVEAVRATLMATLDGHAAPSQGDNSVPDRTVNSPKISAVLHSRLAQLSPAAQRIVAFAATIGRSFTFPLLLAASGEAEDAVVHALDEAWQRRIIRAQGVNTYDFSHDRLRDAAYAEISPVRRPQMHRRIAEALEVVNADDLDAVASQLAVHYEHAGATESAIKWHERAATVLRRLHAYKEESQHLEAARSLLETLPATTARVRQQVSLLISLSETATIVHGLSGVERFHYLNRARELLPSAESLELEFVVLHQLQNYFQGHYAVHKAWELSKELTALAARSGDLELQVVALRVQGRIQRPLGNFAASLAKQQQADALLASADSISTSIFSNTLLVSGTLTNRAHDWCMLGYLDQARVIADKVIVEAETYDPFTRTNAYFMSSLVYRVLDDVEKVHWLGKQMLTQGLHYELPMSIDSGKISLGWARARRGDVVGGIQQMQEGIDSLRRARHSMYQTFRLATLAEFCIQAGQLDKAEAALKEAFDISDEAHERFWDADLHRIDGVLAAARGQSESEIDQHYQAAYDLARKQQAKPLELRAATSLARLWQRQGRDAQAHALLSETVNWFTEGFEWAEYQAAKTLLRELGPAAEF